MSIRTELTERKTAVANAIADQAMEGAAIHPAVASDLERYERGEIDLDTLIANSQKVSYHDEHA
jgi:hypothetical protein